MMLRTQPFRYCGPILTGLICLTGVTMAQESGTSAEENVASPWSVEASAGIEYDDNLGTDESDISTGEKDMAAVLDLSLDYKFPGMSDYEVEAGYYFFQSLYQDYSEFNLQSHSFHLSGSREFNDLDAGLSYRYTRSRLDDDDFMQIHNLQPNLGYSVQPNWYLNLAYSYQDKKFFDDADRDGIQHALSLDNYIVFNGNKSYVRLGYRVEDEDTDGPQFDYVGHYFNAGLSTPLGLISLKTKLDLSYQYFTKDYSNITASIGKERNDHRHTFSIKALSNLSDELFASFKYEYIDASSNLSTADFHENIFTISLGKNW